MKRASVTMLCLICLCFAMPASAQWHIGGVLDLNLANINVDPKPSTEEYSSRLTFGLGGVVDYALAENMDLHAEPMYSQKGAKIEEGGDKITYKTAYFEIPVMFRYKFVSGGRTEGISPYAMAGPTFGFLLNSKFKVDGGPEIDDDETKSFDFGVGLGGGVTIPKGNNTIFAEARYVLGLSNINDDPDEAKVKHRGFQILGGIVLPIGQN